MWHKATGILIYDPYRPGLKRRAGPWWLVLETDNEIARYYRWFIERETGVILTKPAWRAHITLIEGTEPVHRHHWKKYHRHMFLFEYTHDIRTGGPFYWLDVKCPKFSEIRSELGLNPRYPFHLTIGRLPT